MTKRFRTIYADPPWGYTEKRTGGGLSSAAAQKYPTLTIDEIYQLPIESITDKDCALFLWCPTPLIEHGHEALRKWGFEYKTKFIWCKTNFGMGHWLRISTEELLIGLKGSIRPFRLQERNYKILSPIGHSKKPEEFRESIKKAVKNIPAIDDRKIELFASSKYKGWRCEGAAIDGRDIRDVLKEIVLEIAINETIREFENQRR